MKKKALLAPFVIMGALLCYPGSSIAQENTTSNLKDHIKQQRKEVPYLYIGGGYESLYMFGDVYSITESQFHPGHKFNLIGGYKFSPVWGLELKLGMGRMIGSPRRSANQFILGADGMTYYPYTLVDGNEYTPNYTPDGYDHFFGNWDDMKAQLSGTRYEDIEVSSKYYQMGLLGVFNLNRLFLDVPANREQLLTLLVKPGVYLQKFDAQAYTKEGKKNIAPRINSKLSIGLGGDLALHMALNKHIGLELSSGLIWVNDQEFDGIRTVRQAKDDYLAHAGITLMFKLPTQKSAAIVSTLPPHQCLYPSPVCTHRSQPACSESAYKTFAYTLPDISLDKKKERSITERAMLQFNLSKTDLVPSLGMNQLYLNQINELFQQLKSDKDISIEKIMVVGYASPEGPTKFNQELSQGRAQAIAQYLSVRYGISPQIVTSEGKGEDWEGLLRELQSWSYPQAHQLQDIVSSNDDNETKKEELKRLGEPYKKALQELYPLLRRNEITFQFVVKPFTLEESIRLLHSHPEKLSGEEILAVANSYVPFSQLFNETVDMAVKYYPNVEAGKIYKAAILLRQNKSEEAQAYLDSCQEKTGIIENLYGIVHLMKGDKEAARSSFERAIELGDNSAQQNLQMFIVQ